MTTSLTDTRSGEFYRQALEVLPGGVNSPVRAMRAIGRDPIFIARGEGAWEIGTGLATRHQPEVRPARVLHLNGVPAASADIAELVPMLWLTPALDRLFSEGAGERRRFLDRLAFALDANHARRAARYERAMHERLGLSLQAHHLGERAGDAGGGVVDFDRPRRLPVAARGEQRQREA